MAVYDGKYRRHRGMCNQSRLFGMNEDFLLAINRMIEKAMPCLTLAGIAIGFLLGDKVAVYSYLAVPLFAFMTFSSTLNMKVDDFLSTVRTPKYILVFFIVFLGVQPLLAWGISSLLFPGDAQIITGLVLLYSTPIAVSSSIWTDIYKGNMSLSITLILLGTLVAPVATPFLIQLYRGHVVHLPVMSMFISLLLMIVIPSILGICLNELSNGRLPRHLSPICKPLSKFALLLVIIVNIAKIKSSIGSFELVYLQSGLLAIFLSGIGFIGGFFAARFAGGDGGCQVSLMFSTGMRNISAALVLAIAYFSPRTAIPLIIGILFQQAMAAVFGSVLLGREKEYQVNKA
jgi:tagaturonate reductase